MTCANRPVRRAGTIRTTRTGRSDGTARTSGTIHEDDPPEDPEKLRTGPVGDLSA
ncbi:hypothetical protein KUF83_08615 [Streptomyces sp. BV286]|uniref:hypothetical protein n=1 Tax=unclassified Streptomyces TaxID=2593676 RepID=UPI001C2EAD1D|nr:hypothetical protein [Streptomyces sp. BV286]MBV1936625.1 hypothetical protein [Streptomyces sp. BV286]